jgi:hypothetical protein
MSKTRREFLQSSVALAVGVMGGAEGMAVCEPTHRDETAMNGAQTGGAAASGVTPTAAPIQVPKMKFGNAEIGRLVLGCNPINGGAHFNSQYSSLMKEWFTPDRACALMSRANSFGINAFQHSNAGHCPEVWERFKAEGGQMHAIAGDSSDRDPVTVVENLKPHSFHRQGEVVDVAFRNGTMNTVREWCKKVRDTGVMTGVSTHKPEVIAFIEEQGWDVDYYCGCVYNRTRTEDEWRKVLGGELPEMTKEIYIQSDPARMYKVMRQTSKPCFAFKILAAGRIADGGIAQAFRTAFTSIKPIDGVWVGMFPREKDQVKENAEIVHSILTSA